MIVNCYSPGNTHTQDINIYKYKGVCIHTYMMHTFQNPELIYCIIYILIPLRSILIPGTFSYYFRDLQERMQDDSIESLILHKCQFQRTNLFIFLIDLTLLQQSLPGKPCLCFVTWNLLEPKSDIIISLLKTLPGFSFLQEKASTP